MEKDQIVWKEKINFRPVPLVQTDKDPEELIALCKELLATVVLISKKGQVVGEPFLGVILKHFQTISKFNLME